VVANGAKIIANFRSSDVEQRERLVIRIERELLTEHKAMREVLRFEDESGESTYERYQRLYSDEDLSELAETAGFVVTDVYGDLSGARFHPGTSKKIFVVAEKGGFAEENAGRRSHG